MKTKKVIYTYRFQNGNVKDTIERDQFGKMTLQRTITKKVGNLTRKNVLPKIRVKYYRT
jgi:hypothetical protein